MSYTLPNDVKQMLFEEALNTYSLPGLLSGYYDYEKGLRDAIAHYGSYRYYSLSDSYYLFRIDAFESTIQQKIYQFK